MRLRHLLLLIRNSLAQSAWRSLMAAAGIAVGIFVFLTAVALAWGLYFEILTRLRTAMPERVVTARRAALDLGPLRLQAGLITDDEALRILSLPEVSGIWPQTPISFPIRAEGEIFGIELSTDLVVNGVGEGLVRADLPPGRSFDCPADPRKPIPVILSRYFLDLYNLGYAEANQLPKLSEGAVIGRTFRLVLGESTLPALGQSPNARTVPCEIVGLTSNPALLGVVMPADCVAAFNREFAGNGAGYNALHIELRDVGDMDRVEQALGEVGLRLDTQGDLLRRLHFFLGAASLSLLLFGGLVLLVALANVINTFSLILMQRRFEIGLLRALGATRINTVALFLGEAAFIGAAGGTAGALGAWALSLAVNAGSQAFLPPLSLLPPDQAIVQFSGWLALGGILFASSLSVAAAAPIVARETGRAPALLLRQE